MPISTPPLPLVEATQAHLRTRRLGRPMEGHASLDSTNARALSWSRDGAPEGSTVVTDHQTAGRGRHGRSWQAEAGKNLMFSVVLRPGPVSTRPAARPSLLPLAGGLAVCEALAATIPSPAPALKWPNDVLLHGRKCCGVLAETTSSGKEDSGAVVLGIGLNVNQRTFPDVPDSPTPPVSLASATGRPVTRAPLLAQILYRLEFYYDTLFEDDGHALRTACLKHFAALNERVSVRQTASGTAIEGRFVGLAPDGALRLRTDTGQERHLRAGDVTVRPG